MSKYNFLNKSRLFIGMLSDGSTGIFLRDDVNSFRGKLIHTIPSNKKLMFIDEVFLEEDEDVAFSLGDSLMVCFATYDGEKKCGFLEKIEILLNEKSRCNYKKYVFLKDIHHLKKGVYYSEDDCSIELISVYGEEPIWLNRGLECSDGTYFNIDGVEFDKEYNKENREKDLVRLYLKFGDVETLHLTLKLPSRVNENVYVSRIVGSEYFGECYDLKENESGDYLTFDQFFEKLRNGRLGNRIVNECRKSVDVRKKPNYYTRMKVKKELKDLIGSE